MFFFSKVPTVQSLRTLLLATSVASLCSHIAFEMDETADGVKKILGGLKKKGVLDWTSAGKITGLNVYQRKEPLKTAGAQTAPEDAARPSAGSSAGIQLFDSDTSFTFCAPDGFEPDPPEDRREPNSVSVRHGKKVTKAEHYTSISWDYTAVISTVDCNAEEDEPRQRNETPIQMFKRMQDSSTIYKEGFSSIPAVVYAQSRELNLSGKRIACKIIGMAVQTDPDHYVRILDAISADDLNEKEETKRFGYLLALAGGLIIKGKAFDVSSLDPKGLTKELAINFDVSAADEDGFMKAISFEPSAGFDCERGIGQKNIATIKITYYETKGKLNGTERDISDMAEVLKGYTQGVKEVYFTNLELDEGEEGEVLFSADGPYGKFDGLNDVDVFREMASIAPLACFEAEIEGGDSYSQSELRCCLKEGVLKTEVSVNNTEDDDRAYLEYVLGRMPYEKFIDLYGIEADSLAEDDYEDFINDLIIDCSEEETGPFSLDYDAFRERLEDYGGETILDREAYEAARLQAETSGIRPEYDFRNRHDNSVTESYTFDAMTGQYIRG